MVTEVRKIDQIIDSYEDSEGILIQVLLDAQREFNWLPKEVLRRISERLNIPLTQVYCIASFYKAMSLTPRGQHLVSVYLGTACHVRGGAKILDKVSQVLHIKAGETTKDQKFTLRTVNCLGCCALGPVMVVDEEYHGRLPVSKVGEILTSYA